jgi:hypothetical protein
MIDLMAFFRRYPIEALNQLVIESLDLAVRFRVTGGRGISLDIIPA